MPLNLDSCITGIFTPGNIGASSGLPPVAPVMPLPVGPDYFVSVIERANAADIASMIGVPIAVSIVETAAAASTQDVTVTVVARAGMITGAIPVWVNLGTSRQAYVDGIMVNK
jgi:hypothetical protein